MNELVPWLIAVVGALVGILGFNARKAAKRNEETQRKRVDNILKVKGVRDEVDSIADDQLNSVADKWVRHK